jgi:hypothetical protein
MQEHATLEKGGFRMNLGYKSLFKTILFLFMAVQAILALQATSHTPLLNKPGLSVI